MKFKTPLIWYDVQQNWAKIFIVKKVDNFTVQISLSFWCARRGSAQIYVPLIKNLSKSIYHDFFAIFPTFFQL